MMVMNEIPLVWLMVGNLTTIKSVEHEPWAPDWGDGRRMNNEGPNPNTVPPMMFRYAAAHGI